jgi:hypothetical protein
LFGREILTEDAVKTESDHEAHALVSILVYGVHVSQREKRRRGAQGLSPRSVLEKFALLAIA